MGNAQEDSDLLKTMLVDEQNVVEAARLSSRSLEDLRYALARAAERGKRHIIISIPDRTRIQNMRERSQYWEKTDPLSGAISQRLRVDILKDDTVMLSKEMFEELITDAGWERKE